MGIVKRTESFQIMVLRNLNIDGQKNERYLCFLLIKKTKLKWIKDLNIKSETMQTLYKGNALSDWSRDFEQKIKKHKQTKNTGKANMKL